MYRSGNLLTYIPTNCTVLCTVGHNYTLYNIIGPYDRWMIDGWQVDRSNY